MLDNLNIPQKEAVLATEGPVLVLAGAGSGKTKALTHRIAYLIREKKVSPYNILAVTFTNKAAKEMEQRVAHLLSTKSEIRNPKQAQNSKDLNIVSSFDIRASNFHESLRLSWLGTFHSICVKILRRECHHIGFSSSFTIYDDTDTKSVIKRIMKDLGVDPKHYNPSSVQYFISGAKNELIDAKEYKKYINSPSESVTARVYERYEKYLREANAMDFDDLIMQCVLLFQNNPKVLEKYQDQFRYILIDEYQDTNLAQYLWAKLLAAKHKNIMVVGDDSQSIYSWRGANFRNILNFEKHYPNAKVIKLEQNYRSTKTILDAANEVIKYNRQKTDKKLWTENSEGLPITIYEALNEKDEAEFVGLEIRSLVNRSVISTVVEKSDNTEISRQARDDSKNYSNFAVLYRTNAQSRAVEEALIRFDIPYRVVGGVRFYDRKEIKDLIAYLRVIHNPSDMEALFRAATCLPIGIGEKTLAQIGTMSKSELRNLNEIPNNKISKKLKDFLLKIDSFRVYSITRSLPQLIMEIAEKSGMKAFYLDGTAEGEGRWENIQELITVAEQLDEQISNSLPNGQAGKLLISNQIPNDKMTNNQINEKWEMENENSETALEQFLERVALVQDTDNIREGSNAVTLMTLHSAKGLEFENVFIVGVEENIFPHSRALMDESEMEEERRLAYVGITRAKKRLYLIYARERNIYGRWQANERSRFIDNIPEGLLDEI